MKNRLNTSFSAAQESFGFLLWRASNRLQRKHRSALKDFDLTPSQFSVLAALAYLEKPNGALRQSELCEFTQIDKMLISDLVKTLNAKKLISKKADSNDARAFLLTITKSGLVKVNKAIVVVEAVDRDFFENTSRELFADLQRLAQSE